MRRPLQSSPPSLGPTQRELLAGAVEHALNYPYKLWGYGEGPGLIGAWVAGEVLDRPDILARVAQIADRALREQPGVGEERDHLIPVELFSTIQHSPRAHGLLRSDPTVAISRFVTAITQAKVVIPRQPPVHRPSHPTLGHHLWVDCMHTDGPGLVAAGRTDQAVHELRRAVSVLQDDTGLFNHGYLIDSSRNHGVHWARGQGWALYGLVGVLEVEPDPVLHDSLTRLVDALQRWDCGGCWTTIVDDPASPAESSLSPMAASTLTRAIAGGLLPDSCTALAVRAYQATLAAVRADGGLPVSAATPVGPPETYYAMTSGIYPWGQGPLIDALLTCRPTTSRSEQ